MRETYDLTVYNYFKKNLKLCNLTTDKSETVIRCPFCGDSLNLNHAHLYINNLPPFKYFCQKCSTTGIVDGNFLSTLEMYDPEVTSYVKEAKSKYISQLNKKYGDGVLNKFTKTFDILPNNFNRNELKKLKYVNDRLGIEIDDEELLKKYKIILNVKDFFNNNDLKMNKYYQDNINLLNNRYVGFLLNDNNMICFRNITNDNNMRYINKKIYSDLINQSRKFYTIENTIELDKPIYNIYMTEGIFDILGVFNHLYDCKQNSNDLFISCNGKSYNFVLNYLKSIGILNCDINIYSDKDVPIEKMLELVYNNTLIKFNGAKVYYNKLGKDYGVPKDQIDLKEPIEI